MEEKLNKLAEKLKKKRITPLQKYQDNVNEYLTKRLAGYNVPDYVKMEIAQFATVEAVRLVHGELLEVQKDYIKQITKGGGTRHTGRDGKQE